MTVRAEALWFLHCDGCAVTLNVAGSLDLEAMRDHADHDGWRRYNRVDLCPHCARQTR